MIRRWFTSVLLLLLLSGVGAPGLLGSTTDDPETASTAAREGDAWSRLLAGEHVHAKQGFARQLARSPGNLRAAIGLAAIERAQGSAVACSGRRPRPQRTPYARKAEISS